MERHAAVQKQLANNETRHANRPAVAQPPRRAGFGLLTPFGPFHDVTAHEGRSRSAFHIPSPY